MTTTVIGIDPGKTGALAALDVASGDIVWLEDMPAHERVAAVLVAELLEREPRAVIVCEHVASWKNDTPMTAFGLGHAFGVIEGVAGALRRELVLTRPAAWKGAMGLTSDKDRSRAVAQRTWPDWASSFRFKTNADRAEAALLAKWHADRLRARPRAELAEVPW